MKYKNFGAWIIKTDVYVASLWFFVRFGGDCDSYITYIGLFQCNGGLFTLRAESPSIFLEKSGSSCRFFQEDRRRLCSQSMASMNEMSIGFWSSSWVSGKQMGRDIFFVRLQRVTWYCWFSQRVNSNRGHVYKIFGSGNCFVLVCKCKEIFLFFVTDGNLTPLFFTRA